MRKEQYICDICKDESDKVAVHGHKMTVVFTTETTEGRATEPYLATETLDIGEKCRAEIISGKMVFAQGAQGYNTYWFKKTTT